ncbi:MAG: hypothetical protein GX945_07330 [Lentisphaerae bacterium]|nr:hypothetical protein [Lentisphaerota bacterium]
MVKRLRRNRDIMDAMDTMDDNTCSLAVHTVHSSLRERQSSTSDRLLQNHLKIAHFIAKMHWAVYSGLQRRLVRLE